VLRELREKCEGKEMANCLTGIDQVWSTIPQSQPLPELQFQLPTKQAIPNFAPEIEDEFLPF
jgi:hypothetical protein